MPYETLCIEEKPHTISLTINRPLSNNSINLTLLKEINEVLDQAENDEKCSLVVLEGKNGLFCTGMDFQELHPWLQQSDSLPKIEEWTTLYMQTLRRFATSSKVIACKLDGKVIAGGTGFVAASDYVVATERTQFKLTEALWGLMPAMVAPYLVRRIGHQKAFEMTLTARTVSAEEALEWQLVDQINADPDKAIAELSRRVQRLKDTTVKHLKHYFRGLWLIDDAMEMRAIEETTQLLHTDKVKENILNFVVNKKVPWEL